MRRRFTITEKSLGAFAEHSLSEKAQKWLEENGMRLVEVMSFEDENDEMNPKRVKTYFLCAEYDSNTDWFDDRYKGETFEDMDAKLSKYYDTIHWTDGYDHYYITYGECVNQSYKVKACNFDEAKEEALEYMDDGDDLVAVSDKTEWIERFGDYRWPDVRTCMRVATLCHIDGTVEDMEAGWYWLENGEYTPV